MPSVINGSDNFDTATSHKTQVVNIAGGDSSDLTVADDERLAVEFVAEHPKIFTICRVRVNNSVVTWNDVTLTSQLYNVTDDEQSAVDVDITTLTNGPVTAQGKLVGTLTYSALEVGKTYKLRVLLRKSVGAGPVQPANMRIDATIFE